jgi:parallel beta-helix repeat protein
MLHTPRSTRHAVRTHRRATGLSLFVAGSLILGAAGASAQTIHVDKENPAASDGNPGTPAAPFLTIDAAIAAHNGPGVTLVVGAGVYREQVSVPSSGIAGQPFVIRASGPGAIIDGSDDLSGAANWVHTTGTEYFNGNVTWDPSQVFVNGSRLVRSTTGAGSLAPNSFAYVAGLGLHVNIGGDNPGNHLIDASHRDHGFTMSNRTFVTIEGFSITRTNARGINIHTCADGVIANNQISFTGSYGIQAVNSQRMVIEGNTTTDGAFHGIGLTAGTTGSTVRNNESARNAHPVVRQANGIYLSAAPANVITGNRVHHNEDTGVHLSAGSNDCVLSNNRSWANGDHGYDHLASTNATHLHDVASGNYLDGFSFEGNSPGGKVFNCIGVDNGVVASGHNLWVDNASFVGFASDHNLFWNSTLQPIIRIDATTHATLATHQAASGLDLHSVQANPLFTDAANGDLSLGFGSPAIDAATSEVAGWPATDAVGQARMDDPATPNSGAGPVPFADLGALELVPVNSPPVVTSPNLVVVPRGGIVAFRVTANDPDGERIHSLSMERTKLPPRALALFITNSRHTVGAFAWATLFTPVGDYAVRFVARNSLTGFSETVIRIRQRLAGERVDESVEGLVVGPLALSNGFPNPSPGAVDFSLSLPEESEVEWGVYDTQGREIFTEKRREAPGLVQLHWTGSDRGGRRAPTGVYFARVKVGPEQFVRRIVRF